MCIDSSHKHNKCKKLIRDTIEKIKNGETDNIRDIDYIIRFHPNVLSLFIKMNGYKPEYLHYILGRDEKCYQIMFDVYPQLFIFFTDKKINSRRMFSKALEDGLKILSVGNVYILESKFGISKNLYDNPLIDFKNI